MAKTALFVQKQPGGVFTVVDIERHPGNVWFVDSGASGKGDSAGKGRNPDYPFATIAYAFSSDSVAADDVVYVMPGHAETPTAVGTLDIAGVRVIGLGDGNNRPAITFNHQVDGYSLTAADILLENLRFVTPSDTVTAILNVAASRIKIKNCRFELGANVVDAVTITAAGEEPEFDGNVVMVTANGPDSWLKFEGVIDKPVITNNIVLGSDGTNAFDDGVFDFNSVAVTNPVIKDNVFSGANAATTVVANGGSVVGASYGPNIYAASATGADNVSGDSEVLDQLSGATGIPTFPVAAVPADGVSIAEVLRSAWAALEGTAAGENGIVTWPNAAAPANGVSIAEAIRYIVETDFGTLVNTGGTATVGGILGDPANTSFATRLTNILAAVTNPGMAAWGVCDAGMVGSTTAIVSDDLAGYGNDFFNGNFYMQVLLNANSATNAPEDQVRLITDYVSATGTFTCSAFSANVEENDIILILHESQVNIGRDDNNNTAATTNVAANEDGSILERLEQIQEAVNVGTGTSLPANTSLADFVGKGTGTALPANISLYDILGGANGHPSFPNAAVPANDVSMIEVLRDVWGGLMGTAAGENGVQTFPNAASPANNVSLAEVIRAIWAATQGTAAGENGVATWPASAAPANNVSLAEAIGDIWDALRNGTGGSEPGSNRSILDELNGASLNYNGKNYLAVTADLTNATWNTQATHEVFTVTGMVRMRMLIECTADVAGGGSAQFGVAGTTNAFIASTVGTAIDLGMIWDDASPAAYDTFAAAVLDRVVAGGTDVGYEITAAALTGGTLVFHCWWEALNATGAVAAGDGSAL